MIRRLLVAATVVVVAGSALACSGGEEAALPVGGNGAGVATDDEPRRTASTSDGDGIRSTASTSDGAGIRSTATTSGDAGIESSAEVRVAQIISEYDGRTTELGTVLTVPAEVLFDFDADTLRPDAEATLGEVLEVVEFYGSAPVEVVGHTDAEGDAAYNQRLSQRRGEAVAGHLTGAGVDPSRVSVEGKGEDEPVADNGTDDGRQRNRRVEVVLQGVTPPADDG